MMYEVGGREQWSFFSQVILREAPDYGEGCIST